MKWFLDEVMKEKWKKMEKNLIKKRKKVEKMKKMGKMGKMEENGEKME